MNARTWSSTQALQSTNWGRGVLQTSDTIDAVMLEEMKEQIENKFEQEELRGIFNDVDELSDGKLGPEEFAAGLECACVQSRCNGW